MKKLPEKTNLERIGKYGKLRIAGLVLGLIADILITCLFGFVGCVSLPDYSALILFIVVPVPLLFGSLAAAWNWPLPGGIAIILEGLYILAIWLAVFTPTWSPGLTIYVLVFFCLPLFASGTLFICAWSQIRRAHKTD
ncbi:hypothetical protein ACFLVU_03255 [Chloroflexota bacterium]